MFSIPKMIHQIRSGKFTIEAQQLQQIANRLVKNWSLLESPGLWHGKMGIALFFFNYARYTGKELFEDYAMEVIESIHANISWESMTDYEDGLTGIGVGIEYLSQNGFLEIDADEILEDIDMRIQNEIIMQKHENKSIGRGLSGLGKYLLFRLNNRLPAGASELHWLINHERMIHLVNKLENESIPLPKELPDVVSLLCNVYRLSICNLKIERYFDKILKNFSIDNIETEYLFAWVLALLRLVSIGNQKIELVDKIIDLALQAIESVEVSSENGIINQLLWLLQCKRLLAQTELSMSFKNRIVALVNKIYKQMDDIFLENIELSLQGCAGTGIAIMTISGFCDGAWLDLLM